MTIEQNNAEVVNTPVETKQEVAVDNNTEKKETLHLNKDDPKAEQAQDPNNDHAKKIREATTHKVSQKYQYQLDDLNRKNEELKKQLAELSANDESIYDQRLGIIPKNMSIEEYSSALDQKFAQQKEQEAQMKVLQQIDKVYGETSKKITDFDQTIKNSLANKLVTNRELILGGLVNGGYEIIHDLAKNNPQKLIEFQQLADPILTAQLAALAKEKELANLKANHTNADSPINPLTESAPNNVNYENSNYRDGYALWKEKNIRT